MTILSVLFAFPYCRVALVGLLLFFSIQANAAVHHSRILVYTHNGKGYVHDNISASVEALRRIAAKHHLDIDVSDDPVTFSRDRLAQYGAIIFSNTNNQAFDTPDEREAFKWYIERGGGFVGIHSAAGSERDWDYFASVIGGRFVEHAPLQPLTIVVLDPLTPMTAGLGNVLHHTDECYLYSNINPDIHPILGVQRSTLQHTEKLKTNLDQYPVILPIAWYHTFDGGREFYLGLGHQASDYQDPIIVRLLERGILWTLDTHKR